MPSGVIMHKILVKILYSFTVELIHLVTVKKPHKYIFFMLYKHTKVYVAYVIINILHFTIIALPNYKYVCCIISIKCVVFYLGKEMKLLV